MCANLFLQTNVHFQGAIHQAKSWKNQAKAQEIKFQKLKSKHEDLEENLKREEDKLATMHSELMDQRAKKKEIIDLTRTPWSLRPLWRNMTISSTQVGTEGWNEALNAILKRHPGLFSPTDFPSPHPLAIPQIAVAEEEEEEDHDSQMERERERILDPTISPL